MKKFILSILILLLVASAVEAQRRNGLINRRIKSSGAIIVSLGPTFTFADPKGLPFRQPDIYNQFHLNLGYRRNLPNNFSIKGAAGYYRLSGSDGDYSRGHSFVSQMFQVTARGEYSYYIGYRYARRKPNSVYGFLGVGVAHNIADLTIDNTTAVDARYKYKPTVTAPIIPYGVGYRYDVSSYFSMGMEINFDYIFSDYIDGFKPPRPRSLSNDVLQGFSANLVFKLRD